MGRLQCAGCENNSTREGDANAWKLTEARCVACLHPENLGRKRWELIGAMYSMVSIVFMDETLMKRTETDCPLISFKRTECASRSTASFVDPQPAPEMI